MRAEQSGKQCDGQSHAADPSDPEPQKKEQRLPAASFVPAGDII